MTVKTLTLVSRPNGASLAFHGMPRIPTEAVGVEILGEATVNNLTYQAYLILGADRRGRPDTRRKAVNGPALARWNSSSKMLGVGNSRGFARCSGGFGETSPAGGLAKAPAWVVLSCL